MAALLKTLVFTSLLSAAFAAHPLPSGTTRTCSTQAPRPGICGVHGNIRRNADSLIRTVTKDSVDACRDACFATSSCVSFAFTASSSACGLHRTGLGGRNIKTTPNGPLLYNRKCFYDCSLACTNVGYEFAEYTHEYNAYDPEDIKTLAPNFLGATYLIGGFNSFNSMDPADPITLYENYTINDPGLMAINHRGYIIAPQTGTYSIATNGDEKTLYWIGDNAYSGWTTDNANNMGIYLSEEDTTIDLVEGEIYPFRVLYANNDGQYYFEFSMKNPDGTTLLGPHTEPNPNIITHSCDGVKAPVFPEFGQET